MYGHFPFQVRARNVRKGEAWDRLLLDRDQNLGERHWLRADAYLQGCAGACEVTGAGVPVRVSGCFSSTQKKLSPVFVPRGARRAKL